MPVKGGYLLVAGAGAILLWSGVKGHKWSAVAHNLLSGESPASAPTQPIVSSSAAFGYGTGQIGGPIPNLGVGGSVTKNKTIGAALATVYGWGPGTSNWTSLVELWTRESGWNNRARNPSSGAYGIPQSLPPSKMGALANPPVSSASAQIKWGLKDIKTTYGDPDGAWAHEEAYGWY
jgi:resuscitation-promoting factor RpfB